VGAVVALELRVLRIRQRRLAVGAGARDGLDARGDVGVAVAGLDRVGADADRVEARRAVARDGRAGHLVRELLREEDRDAADVVGLLALCHAAAADQVLDRRRIDIRVALEQLVDDVGGQVVGPHLRERALEGTPDRCADGIDDDCFRHLVRPLSDSSAA